MDGLSIGILSHNGKDVLEKCVRCILTQELPEKIEVFIVDNNSPDGSEETIAKQYGLRVVKADNKHHFITGLNTVFKEAFFDTVLFVSNDVFFRPNSILNMYNWTKDGKKIVQPVFYGMDGKIQNAGMNYIWPGYGMGKKKKNFRNFNHMITTTALMMRKEIFNKVGEFDINFDPAFCEDNDYSIRANKLNIKTLVFPFSEADHGTSHTFSHMRMDKTISQICHENRQKVIQKNFKGFDKWSRLLAMKTIDNIYYLLRDVLGFLLTPLRACPKDVLK